MHIRRQAWKLGYVAVQYTDQCTVCMYVYYDKCNDVHDIICGNTVTRLLVPSVMWSGHMDTYPALTDSHR